jgi:peptide/nickel transport system ATP-binding protein
VALLEVRDLHVWFALPRAGELHAVRGVSFDVERGELFGLIGESGCGKTTTILALMGLLPSSAAVAGSVKVDGEDVLSEGEKGARSHRWTEIAMVFQGSMNAFSPVKTIGWQIAEPMEIHGLASRRTARVRAGELLDLVGIPAAAAERYPHQFSGGMRQRAAIAMALSCQPKLLLADEPTTALDVMVQAQILELLQRLARELHLTVVLVTHDLPLVAHTCNRAAVMYAGEIAEVASVDALYHDSHHPYTRMLFAATPELLGSRVVASIPGNPPRLDRAVTGCAFRARCDSSIDRCAKEHPSLVDVGEGHRAACHLNDPMTSPLRGVDVGRSTR